MNKLNILDRLKSLTGCGDIGSLRSAVQELCTEFGKVTRIDVLTMTEAEKRRALCFLRLESAAQERQLMSALGASRFGDDVLVIVDLPSDYYCCPRQTCGLCATSHSHDQLATEQTAPWRTDRLSV